MSGLAVRLGFGFGKDPYGNNNVLVKHNTVNGPDP